MDQSTDNAAMDNQCTKVAYSSASAQFCQDAEIFQRRRVAGDLLAAGDFLEQTPHDFSAARFRQRLGKTHFIGFGDRADVLADVFAQFFFQAHRSASTPLFSVTNATTPWPFISSGRPTTAASATLA